MAIAGTRLPSAARAMILVRITSRGATVRERASRPISAVSSFVSVCTRSAIPLRFGSSDTGFAGCIT